MAKDEAVNASNQTINTTQPKVMRGLILRGVKSRKMVTCIHKGFGPEDADVEILVAEDEYDRQVHGPKKDKLPKRSAKAEDGGNKQKDNDEDKIKGKDKE